MSDPATPSLTAIHEAGHTAVALFCRMPVERVTIVREGSTVGKCWFWVAGAPPIITAAVYLAGFLAEKIIDPFYADIAASSSDITAAGKLVVGTDYEDLVPRTRRRLYLLWGVVDRVATALDREGTLVGADHIRSVARLTSWLG